MNKLLLVIAVLLQAGLVTAQGNDEKEPYLTKPLSTETIRDIEAKTSGGSISVTGVAPSEARIEVYVSPNNNEKLSATEIKQRLEELYTLDISVANNKLTAVAKSRDRIRDWKKALSIGYRIYVPSNVASNLQTSGGSISLENLQGEQKFATSGGSLHVKKVGGKVDGVTSGGSIHLEDATDEIDLHTSGGSIHAKNSSGNIRLATSGGSLELVGLKGNIKATTSGGRIHGKLVEGELNTATSGGSIELTDLMASVETATSGGRIDLSFKEMGKYVKVHNSAGNINIVLPKDKGLDLDVSGRIETSRFANFDGQIGDRHVRGKLNGGGVPVTVNAGHGKVRIELQ